MSVVKLRLNMTEAERFIVLSKYRDLKKSHFWQGIEEIRKTMLPKRKFPFPSMKKFNEEITQYRPQMAWGYRVPFPDMDISTSEFGGMIDDLLKKFRIPTTDFFKKGLMDLVILDDFEKEIVKTPPNNLLRTDMDYKNGSVKLYWEITKETRRDDLVKNWYVVESAIKHFKKRLPPFPSPIELVEDEDGVFLYCYFHSNTTIENFKALWPEIREKQKKLRGYTQRTRKSVMLKNEKSTETDFFDVLCAFAEAMSHPSIDNSAPPDTTEKHVPKMEKKSVAELKADFIGLLETKGMSINRISDTEYRELQRKLRAICRPHSE